MAAKAKAGKKSRIQELWPGPFTVSNVFISLSIMLNVALAALLIILAQTNVLDDQIASRGAEILCSEEYRASADNADAKALLDYTCVTDKAQPFFVDGYNKYRESINLKAIQN